MKPSAIIFTIITFFFLIVTPIYWFMSNDPTGTTALTLTFGLGAMISFYFLLLARRMPSLPEDDDDGEIYQRAGEYGFFSPHSWWPLGCAAAASVVFIGLATAWFIVIIGVALAALAVIGMVFEYYRGEHAH
jgi:hypothetical protein